MRRPDTMEEHTMGASPVLEHGHGTADHMPSSQEVNYQRCGMVLLAHLRCPLSESQSTRRTQDNLGKRISHWLRVSVSVSTLRLRRTSGYDHVHTFG